MAEGVSDPGAAFSLGWEQAPAEPSTWPDWLINGAVAARHLRGQRRRGRSVFDPSGGADGVAFWSTRTFDEISVHRCTVVGSRDELIHLIDNMNLVGAG